MFKNLILAALLIATTSHGALVEGDRAIVDQVKNIVENPGFESGRASWTASGGSVAASSAAKAFGALGYSWDSSAASQTVTGKQITVPEGLKGQNAVLSCAFKTVSGVATHKLQAFDGTNVVAEASITSITGNFARTVVNFVAPSSGTLAPRVISVAANEPEIYFDDCVLGYAYNVGTVSQASLYARMRQPGATNCSVSVTAGAGTYSDFATMGSCAQAWTNIGASVTNSATSLSQTLNNLGPGYYRIIYTGYLSSSIGQSCYWRFSDGTTTFGRGISGGASSSVNTSGIEGLYVVTAGGSPTIKIQGASSGGTSCTVGSADTPDDQTWTIYKYPSSSEQAFRPELLALSWSGYHDNTCDNWSTTSTTYVDPTDGSCALVERTNSNFGSVTTSGGPNITFTPKKLGKYYVCAVSPLITVSASNYGFAKLTDGTTTIAELDKYGDRSQMPLCGIYNVTSLAAKTLKVQIKTVGASTTVLGGANGSAIEWSIFAIDQQLPAPVLVGSVTSGAVGAERIERVKVASACSGSPCTITSQSGVFSSVTRSATGTYSANITSGVFSSAPTCSIVSGNLVELNGVITTTSVPFITINTVPIPVDSGFDIVCMGPR